MTKEITIYHSPDADDAFMFYGLVSGAVNIPGYSFTHELSDIETLNKRTLAGELDVTAVSVHAFAYLNDHYAILRSGASMGGKDYGPRLVVKGNRKLQDLKKIAIPGQYTSAALALRLYLHEQGLTPELPIMHFEKIQDAVKDGEIEAGVLIHEGQITHAREGLTTIVDLGEWWWNAHELPLPLGVNVVRKALGEEALQASSQALRTSIEYSLNHREKALDYALSYGRGLSRADADTFVGMYVNDWTRDLGEKGMRSIRLFLQKGVESKILPREVEVTFY